MVKRSLLMIGLLALAGAAAAQTVVECASPDYRYHECDSMHLSQPQLIYQISSSACILNRTWGFNYRGGYIWVDDGCAGRFADAGGYHHGRTGGYDSGARRYTAHGEDAGEIVGGEALGALLAGTSTEPKAEPTQEPPAIVPSPPPPDVAPIEAEQITAPIPPADEAGGTVEPGLAADQDTDGAASSVPPAAPPEATPAAGALDGGPVGR